MCSRTTLSIGVDNVSDVLPWMKKRPAAEKAVDDYVRDGMTIGLGTGNAANMAIGRIAELVDEGYDLKFVATSLQTASYAQMHGLEISDIDQVDHIDVTIDGADEVDPDLNMIKGLGGALLREKIVASLTEKEIIVVDGFKVTDVLGKKVPLPVEVCRFAHSKTASALSSLGCEPLLRTNGDGKAFVSDGGNYIYDCRFKSISDPVALESAIDVIPGVVECGLFIGMAYAVEAYYEESDSVKELTFKDRTAGLREYP